MRKIILATLVLFALSSCKKETQKTVSESSTFVSPEISPEKLGQYLAKNNDTLYVTNFFATWCGPCMKEIPHFKNKMVELKGKPVKFTFVNLDEKSDWSGAVKKFADENGLAHNIVLLDGKKLDHTFFAKNFKQWDGGSIPFTYMRKGNTTDEFLGMMTEETLNAKINSLLK